MIRFETNDCAMPSINTAKVTGWIHSIAELHGKKAGEINYIFCSDSKIIEFNKQYLDHDFYTDIITFDYSEGDRISGDIFVGLETVFSNAARLGHKEDQELMRVIIHGILHLCGFKDKTPKDEATMHEQEDLALSYL
ncbi:MAG TPA: rRNA maturation RNase YbeY [Bacteroidales bacterium]|nr:rRNA maturation RNase YbeY [Bacteroidales bacterium]